MAKLKIIEHKNVEELENKLNEIKDVKLYKRLLCILFIQRDGLSGYEISRKLNVSHTSVSNWVKSYNKSGIDGLRDKRIHNKRGDTFKNPAFFKELENILYDDCPYGGVWTGKKILKWIKKKYNRDFVVSTVYFWLDEIGFSWQSVRPKHKNSNKLEQEKFKKNRVPA